MHVTRLLTALCWLHLAGCMAPDADSDIVQERLYAMGTWVDIAIAGTETAAAASALADIERMLRTFERDYYPWADGALAQLNGAIAAGRDSAPPRALLLLLERAKALSIASGGLFEPGVAPLVELWGFNSTLTEHVEPPSGASIEAALNTLGRIASLHLDDGRASAANRNLKIDLGGIAKGAAVEAALLILASHGLENALINAGGDLAAIGHAAGGRAWRVGIRDPRGPGMLSVVELGDGESAFTSGDYERYFEHEGERLHHLLDPTTGRPARHTQAITVLSTDPVLADAAATALFVAGPTRWRALAEKLGIDAALRVDADGTVELTPTLAARLGNAAPTHAIIAQPLEEPTQ